MKTVRILIVCLSVLAFSSCSNMFSSVQRTVSEQLYYVDDGVEDLDKYPILRATGYASLSMQKGPTAAQKSIQAMRASKLEAYRELLEQVYGVYVESSNRLGNNTVETQYAIKGKVDGLVHGARVVRQYPLGDSYVTELELDTKVLHDLYKIRGAL